MDAAYDAGANIMYVNNVEKKKKSLIFEFWDSKKIYIANNFRGGFLFKQKKI